MDLKAGQQLGPYELEREVGTGGMGAVWAGRDTRSQRMFALKVIRGEQASLDEARIRFRREAHAARSIAHPAIVPVTEVLDHDGSPVLVMELLVGDTLRGILRREDRLTLTRTAELLLPVAEALDRAHGLGIVHRDLKPENVFVEVGGEEHAVERARLLDFGVARFHEPVLGPQDVNLTGVGVLIGTAAYMAPEQALCPSDVDYRVDIWALGVILYEALSGCRPIEGMNSQETLRSLLIGSITPLQVLLPELPQGIAELVSAMLSRNPDRRPSNLEPVMSALQPYTRGRPGHSVG